MGKFAVETEDFYSRTISTVEAALGELLEAWGRAPAGPLTVRDLVRGQQAMLGGMLLHHLSGQDTPSACDLYEVLVTRFIMQNTVERRADMD